MPIEFAVLGPLQVRVDGHEHHLGGFTRRATLAYLLLHPNHTVSISDLTNALWPTDHPRTARGILLNAVSALRKAGIPITTRKPGYQLQIDPDHLDLHRFRTALNQATKAAPDQAATILRNALTLWRGPVLADLVAEGITWPALTKITELHDQATEDRYEAELAAGRHREVTADLEALAKTHPTRERVQTLLMLALYRSGRQTDALATARTTRHHLATELGVDPGQDLVRLEQAILTQDPALSAPPRTTLTVQERKKISVLAIRLDLPGTDEAADEHLATTAAEVRARTEALGGTTITTLGSTICAAFGAPRNREDDAQRATRAALEITGTHPAAAAVATGPALVTSGDEVTVSGTVLDAATNLLTQTKTGEVSTCPVTTRATTPTGDDTPFIGRTTELEKLQHAYEQVTRTGHPRVITVLGEPGTGKTRLVREFTTGKRTLTGRTPAFAGNDTFAPLADVVRAHAGILDTDDAGTVTEKIQAIDGDPWLTTQLKALVGVGPQGNDVLTAWRRLVEHLADEPLTLVIEDVHWADDLVTDFLHDLATTTVPLLVLLTTRPNHRTRTDTLPLHPLSEEDTAELLTALAKHHHVDADLTELEHRAQGNPLFAAEYVRMLRDGAPEALPETVQNVIGARLDSLPQLERSVLQDAAVIGETVWPGVVAAVADRDRTEITRCLEILTQRDFLRRNSTSNVAGEAEYAFSHVLVRDVAYDRVPRGTKAMKHYHAAEWVRSLPLEHVPLLAHHFQEAVWIAEASGRPCDIMGAKARTALTDAGRRATNLAARETAIRCYRAALAVCPDGHPDTAELLTLLGSCLAQTGDGTAELARAIELHTTTNNFAGAAQAARASWRSAWHRGDHEAARHHLDQAIEFLDSAPAHDVQAYVAHALTLTDRLAEAITAAESALQGAKNIERAIALEARGLARVKQGHLDGFDDLRQAVTERERAGISTGLCLFNTSTAHTTIGDAKARQQARAEARAAALRHGDQDTLAWLTASSYVELFWDKRYTEALKVLENPAHSHLLAARGRIRLLTGDLDGAKQDAATALAAARTTGIPTDLHHPLTLTARIALHTGEKPDTSELVTVLQGHQITGLIGVDLPVVLAATGHTADSLATVSWSRWKDAAVAHLSGDKATAKRIYQEIGSRPDADDESLVIARP
ncbi:BTAD domain-containing putative transcriptional regulator [Lentzea sp. NPDC058450]|uniref:BTAD domain-containing putative transcriptional regulator n=1 Tax=Lentzea sp. NPDC058450 TaxID=3346505 RepID=UPI003654525C